MSGPHFDLHYNFKVTESTTKLDGKLVATYRRELLKERVREFTQKTGYSPHLVVILVGELAASMVYVRNKEKSCAEVGIRSTRVSLRASIPQAELNKTIEKLNSDPDVDAILVQLPLSDHLQVDQVFSRLSPDKDADGQTYINMGHLLAGDAKVNPCTPQGIMNLLKHYQFRFMGKQAVVVGRSTLVGKPMAQLLTAANATVTLCHSHTTDLSHHTRAADLVVVAAGKREFLRKEDFAKGAVVVDVGIHGSGAEGGKITGDVKPQGLEGWLAAYSPVPGGVGPMTITTLLENTVALAEMRHKK